MWELRTILFFMLFACVCIPISTITHSGIAYIFRARPTYAYGCDQQIINTDGVEDTGFNSKCTMLIVITCYASIEETEEDWIVTYLVDGSIFKEFLIIQSETNTSTPTVAIN